MEQARQVSVQEYTASKVILANGTSPRMFEISGEKEFTGERMCMNAVKHVQVYKVDA